MKRPVDIFCGTKQSLVHMGSLDSFDITEGGIHAANQMLQYFETHEKACLQEAIKAYDRLIPHENFGGEYTALRWICKLLLAPSKAAVAEFMEIPEVDSWYRYLLANDFARLKTYITYKYHFTEIAADDSETKRMLRFLEDFILFSNPDREYWEGTAKMLRKLRITGGLTVADVGCGSGYFTFKFADMVGEQGKVYGIEINPLHLDYLHKHVEKHAVKNVEIIKSNLDGIGIDPAIKVDIVFSCSLFHVLYSSFTEKDRNAFIKSIDNALLPGGSLIVVDNDLVAEGELPYHGPYIAKDLLVSQLHYYGFRLAKKVQVTKQRYAIVFKKDKAEEMPDKTDLARNVITALSGTSLVKFALADAAPTAGYTENGRAAAGLFLTALAEKTPESIEKARAAYEKIIPCERIGDEYTAFVWFCDYLKAGEKERAEKTEDPLAKEYFDYLAGEDFALLKQYVRSKYELRDEGEAPLANLMQISEYVAFNNPSRDRWEKTGQMLDFIGIKPGEAIADVGCGSGYFTYQFAKSAGPDGKVWATEINKGALHYVEAMRDRYKLNIIPAVAALNDAKLPFDTFDKIFMCSMYHAVYVASIEYVKDAFIASIKNALKSDGKLYIVDNEAETAGGAPDYYGSGIDRRLVISQLTFYGFRLVAEAQFIPQRYILVFEKGKD